MAESGGEADQAPTGTAQTTLLARMEQFERWSGNEAIVRTQPLTTDPEVDVHPILPQGWRTETQRRPRRRRRRRQARPIVRRARWWVLILLIFGGSAAAAVLVYVPKYAESLADDTVADYQVGLVGVDESIPAIGTALDALASTNATAEDLATPEASFMRFRNATLALSDVVRDPLPEVPPLFPDDPIQELGPVRDRVALVAGRADVVSGRIGRLVAYRTALDDAFVLPELPAALDPTEINDISLALAQLLAESLDAVTRLPADPFLDEHRALVAETLDWFRDWEIRYLEALRKEEPVTATAVANEAGLRLRALRQALGQPLADFEVWARQELAGLQADVSAALVVVEARG